jgi:hypothetical protein
LITVATRNFERESRGHEDDTAPPA